MRMPDRLPQVRAPRAGGVRVQARDVSSGLGDVGEALEHIADTEQRQFLEARDTDDRLAMASAATRLRASQTQRLLDEGDALEDDGVEGFSERYNGGFTEALEVEVTALPQRLQARARVAFADVGADLGLRARDVEHTRRVARQGRLLDDQVSAAGAIVFADPTQYGAVLSDARAAIETSGLPGADRAAALSRVDGVLAGQRMLGLVESNPALVVREIEAGEWNGVLQVEQLARFRGEAQRELDRRRAEAERRAGEARARAADGLRIRMADDLASRRITGRGAEISLAQVEAAFGADAAAAYARQQSRAEGDYEIVRRFSFETPDQIRSTVARLLPRPGAAGFAEALERAEEIGEIAAQVLSQRAQDPAAAALAADPALAQSWAGLPSADANSRRIVLEQMRGRQERLGIPAGQQRLVTNGQAADWAGRVRDAAPGARAGELEAVTREVEGVFGGQSGRALAEIARVAEAPEIGALAAIPDAQARRRAARALTQPEPEVSQGVRRRAGQIVDERLALLARSLAFTPGGAERLAAARAAALRVALAESAAGAPVADAARAAADAYAQSYQFRDGWRLPRLWNGAALNAGRIARGAENALEDLRIDGGVALPAGRADAPPNLQRQATSDALSTARWISAPSDGGLLLVDEFGDAIADSEGRPIQRSWDELNAAARRRRDDDPTLIERAAGAMTDGLLGGGE